MQAQRALRGVVLVMLFAGVALIASYLFRIVLAQSLTVEQYGLFYALYAFFLTATFVTDFGTAQAAVKYIIKYRVANDHKRVKSILWYSFLFQIGVSLLIVLFIFFAKDWLLREFFKVQDPFPLYLMMAWFVTLPFITFISNVFLGFQRSELTGSIDAARQVGALALTGLLLWYGLGKYSPFIAFAVLNILLVVVYMYFVHKTFPGITSTKHHTQPAILVDILRFGWHVTFIGLIGILLTQTDTLVLTYLIGVTAAGLYQVAVPVATAISFFGTTVMMVGFPLIAELNERKQYKQLHLALSLIHKYILIVAVPVAALTFVYAEGIIVLFFGAKYIIAANALRGLAVANLCLVLTTVNNSTLLAVGRTAVIGKVMAVVAAINLALNFALIPFFGITGAAMATATSLLLAAIISSYKVREITHTPLPVRSWITTLFAGAILGAVIYYTKNIITLPLYFELAIILVVASIVYALLLFVTDTVTFSEVRSLWRMLVSSKASSRQE